MSSNPGSITSALSPYASVPASQQQNVLAFPEPFHWYQALPATEKVDVIDACLKVLDNRTSDCRDRWLRVLFAVADAGRLGCTGARELALAWSQQGVSWTGEGDFDVAWNSFKPQGGNISVGSLVAMAREAGLDLSPWSNAQFTRAIQAASLQQKSTISAVMATASSRAVNVASLPAVPLKRRWLHGTDLIRGAVTLLVAPGGRAKSTWLLLCALACASGRPLLGSHVFGGPLRVLCLSTEDGISELALRIRASMKHHKLEDKDVSGLYVIGADRWGLPLLQMTANGPMVDQHGLDTLTAELDALNPDVLIIDPLINILGGVSANENSAAALLMGNSSPWRPREVSP